MCKEYIWICLKCRRQRPGDPTQKDPCDRKECDQVFEPVYVGHPSWCNDCNDFRHTGVETNSWGGWRPAQESVPDAPPNPTGPVGTPSTFNNRGGSSERSITRAIGQGAQHALADSRAASPAQQQRSSTPHRQLSGDHHIPAIRRTASSLIDPAGRQSPPQDFTVSRPRRRSTAPKQPLSGSSYAPTSRGTAPSSTGFGGSARGPLQYGSDEVGSSVANAPQAQSTITLPEVPDIGQETRCTDFPIGFVPQLDQLPMPPLRLPLPRMPFSRSNYQNPGAPHPLKAQLAPLGYNEPEEWELWRTNNVEAFGRESKNGRYQYARALLPDWYLPLPYEPEQYYIDRQAVLGRLNTEMLRFSHQWREYFDLALANPNDRYDRRHKTRRQKVRRGQKGDSVTDPLSGFDPKTSNSWRGGHDGGRGGRGGGGDRGGPGGAASGFIPAAG